jgi:CRP-like cAMP-binding protein
VDVGVSYDVPPNQVKAALAEALGNAPLALATPAPDLLVSDFGASAVIYKVRFWINDFARDTAARDQVRSAIYYSLRRHRFEIPFPMQVEMLREPVSERPSDRMDRLGEILKPIDLFGPLTGEERAELAARAAERLYGQGETIVRQGDAGDSMFVIGRGRVRVVEASGRELAVFAEGGYFGEMSMLTGQPRSASVQAMDECQVVELTAASLREVALANPDVVTRIGTVVSARQVDLDRQKAEAAAERPSMVDTHRSLLTRIQEFLRLPNLLGD